MSGQTSIKRARYQDSIGKSFGDWIVLSFARMSKHRETMVLCRCVCGREKEVLLSSIKREDRSASRSCGCRNRSSFSIAAPAKPRGDVPLADLAWAAGFFDGEGSVSIVRSSRRSLHITVMVSNKNPKGVLHLHSCFGGFIHADKRSGGCCRWCVNCRVAESFLRSIRPFVKQKGDCIDVALRFQDTIGGKGHRASDEVFALRLQLRAQLMELNAKD